MKNLFKTTQNSEVKSSNSKRFDKFTNQVKRIFINPDGTLAENRDTYLAFHQDLIKSSGWAGC